MPEQFEPITMTNGSGMALDQDYFNRLEAAHELADTRATALELGVRAPISIAYSSSITPNAAEGSNFRCVATGDLTLNSPTGGVDGQTITVRVKASGAGRLISFQDNTAAAVTIASGQWYTAELTYDQADDTWVLED